MSIGYARVVGHLMAVLGALVFVAGPTAAQTTKPSEPAKGAVGPMADVTLQLWTCEEHEQFRMPVKGECPLCEKKLVRRRVEWVEPYPMDTCVVSGQKLGSMGDPIVMTHEGREVRFCCAGCIKRFEDNAAEYWGKINEQIIEQQLAYYPTATCFVSGEALDSMGEPVNYVHNNRLVRFCCKGCLRGFKKDSAPVLAALDTTVIEQQMAEYPLESCPISKQALGSMGEPVDYVVANRLVRFCCGGCAYGFYKDASTHLAALNKAWGERQER